MECHVIKKKLLDLLKANTKDANVAYVRDNLGSIIFIKQTKTKGPKILIATHMDEVGYVVNEIFDSGLLGIAAIGGV